MRTITISVCMIVKDEEPVLERCLKNVVKFADELVIVDTGSSDNTKRIAEKYTDKVFDYTWQDDFASARNFSFEKGTCDFLMWVDADDVIAPSDIEKINELKFSIPSSADVVYFTYSSEPNDDDILSGGMLLRDRLIRRSLNPIWRYPIHESIIIYPEWNLYFRPDINILHKKLVVNEKGRNLRIFEKALANGFQLDNNNRRYYCRELACAGRYEEAVNEFNRLWKTNNQNNIHYAMFFYIGSMIAMRRFDELKIRLEEFGKKFCFDEMILCTLGDLYRHEKNYEESIRLYQQAMDIKIDITDRKLHFSAYHDFLPLLGMCKSFFNQGKFSEGDECLTKAEQIYPSYKEIKILKSFSIAAHRKQKKSPT